MKSVGEAMAIGRTFREALGKAIRSLETGRAGFDLPMTALGDDLAALERAIAVAVARPAVPGRPRRSSSASPLERAHELTRIDPWFLHHIREIALAEIELAASTSTARRDLRRYKRLGMSDRRIAALTGATEAAGPRRAPRRGRPPGLQARRHLRRRVRVAHAVHVLDVRGRVRVAADRQAEGDHPRRRTQPHRPGHRVRLLLRARRDGARAKRASSRSWSTATPRRCRPTTTRRDRLYFEPLTLEDVLEICDVEKPWGVIVQFGGQTPLKLAVAARRRRRADPRHDAPTRSIAPRIASGSAR